MKTIKTVLVAAALALAAFIPQKSSALGSVNNLNATNFLGGLVNTNITTWPTNTISTNGLPQNTGNYVAIGDQEHLVFVFQGFASNAAAAIVSVSLTTACTAGNPPIVRFDYTNGFENDFCGITNGTTVVGFTTFQIAVPATTNWFHWETNLIMDAVGGTGAVTIPNADYVGIYQITNNIAAGSYITTQTQTNNGGTTSYTNITGAFMWGINKKTIPTPLVAR